MKYHKEILLKNGKACLLRSATKADAEEVLKNFLLTHGETDYLLTYPDETPMSVEGEEGFLQGKAESANEAQICAVVDGRIVAAAGVDALGSKDKVKHRADFGISVEKAYWGLGIGRALTLAVIECARNAGYEQMELQVVSENAVAVRLYESVGFVEFGRNPRGFRTREGKWQELVEMRLELN